MIAKKAQAPAFLAYQKKTCIFTEAKITIETIY